MSTDANVNVSSDASRPRPTLGAGEGRVLGVLVEKAKTTPDAYPLSLNALVAGCNQKSNRAPLLNLADQEVEEGLTALQKTGLVTRITGSRVDRWRHNLYEAWQVDKVELAVLAELLLRGAQTEGELRAHASRMEPLEDLDQLRPVLGRLKERGLVVYLGPEGRRGTTLTHGFHSVQELAGLQSAPGSSVTAAEPPSRPTAVREDEGPAVDRLATLESGLAQTRSALAALQEQVAQLVVTLENLSRQLTDPRPPAEE